ncbi:hypothetical protein [Algicella marina]|uniref:Uncharacterized protein n=1 Tax=Algicella marina TaxID=2683284 RepID=A0A6P1T0C1_9RHOB|nr:hypothetical protein [Algicella marina]QHQ34886.1 hypothetical protein GO499_06560 [Algicella marina]
MTARDIEKKAVSLPAFEKNAEGALSVNLPCEKGMFALYGIETPEALEGLLHSGVNALGEGKPERYAFIPSLMAELKPRDVAEAMLITQMGATHLVLADLSRRIWSAGNAQMREALERSMTRLSRTYMSQMEALKKYRAKAQQIVRVERVTVENGGRAIVGAVSAKGEG